MTLATTSAIVLKWFRDLCAPGREYDEFLRGVETIPVGCDGLCVLPHFMGTSTPAFDPRVRGAFVGLTLGHTRAHLARAIMESCACLLEECLGPIIEHGLSVRSVRSLGGAARNDLWLQMKADLLGIVVERPVCADAASLGAAVLAAAGTGRFSSIAEASEAWYRPARLFEPDPARYQIYREVYTRYLGLMQRLYGDAASQNAVNGPPP
jgi:xylulokinase